MYSRRIMVEGFHFMFLDRLLKLMDPKAFVLKGGVNLRFFFQSPRYSEDMDLDVFKIPVHVLREKAYSILSDKAFHRNLETLGIPEIRINDPQKAKQTETTQRFRLRLVTRTGDEFPTKVEFSRRETKGEILTDLVNFELARKYQRIAFRSQHYSGTTTAIQKVKALIHRSVPQVRDVFDLFILYMGGHIPKKEIQKAFDPSDLQIANERLISFSYKEFEGQVLEYLDESDLDRYEGKKEWEEIQEKILNLLSTHDQ